MLALYNDRSALRWCVSQIDNRVPPSLERFERDFSFGLQEIANQFLKVLARQRLDFISRHHFPNRSRLRERKLFASLLDPNLDLDPRAEFVDDCHQALDTHAPEICIANS